MKSNSSYLLDERGNNLVQVGGGYHIRVSVNGPQAILFIREINNGAHLDSKHISLRTKSDQFDYQTAARRIPGSIRSKSRKASNRGLVPATRTC